MVEPFHRILHIWYGMIYIAEISISILSIIWRHDWRIGWATDDEMMIRSPPGRNLKRKKKEINERNSLSIGRRKKVNKREKKTNRKGKKKVKKRKTFTRNFNLLTTPNILSGLVWVFVYVDCMFVHAPTTQTAFTNTMGENKKTNNDILLTSVCLFICPL